jgi:hypothetical protein
MFQKCCGWKLAKKTERAIQNPEFALSGRPAEASHQKLKHLQEAWEAQADQSFLQPRL